MMILSLDPGPKTTGYAILDAHGPRTVHVRSGKLASTTMAFVDLGVATFSAVIVERPRGMAFQPFRVPQLLDTAYVAGEMAGVARLLRVRVEELTAQEVRKLLCGKANATDTDVEHVVRANVARVPAQTNEHERDAIAVGLVGAWIIAGRISRPVATTAKPPRKAATRRVKV